MSQYRRTAGTPGVPQDDELAARIASAVERRVAGAPDPADVATAVEDVLAGRRPPRSVAVRRGGQIAAAGVVTGTLALAAGSAAAASNPYSPVAAAVESAAQTVGLDVSFMPEGYTREQYEAYTTSDYTMADQEALGRIWRIDGTELKARIGQAILDGEQLPVAAGTTPQPPGVAELDAYWDAGYNAEEAAALGALWGTETRETKIRAGRAILDGQPLPVPPSGNALPAPSSGDTLPAPSSGNELTAPPVTG